MSGSGGQACWAGVLAACSLVAWGNDSDPHLSQGSYSCSGIAKELAGLTMKG